MQDITDTDLLTRWRAGDREAYAVLVARHFGLIQAACRRQAAPGDDEDCAQAVFLVLSRKPASAMRAPNLEAWLLRVSWYVCQHSRRAAQRRRQAEHDAAAVSGPRPVTAKPEALDHLDSCMMKLPKRQRTAVALHYLAGKPAEEVAVALGVSRENAYQLISRGLAAMRALLAKRGVAVAGTALASLLASEGQAASASAPTAALASLTATPTASAASLASGAITAMHLSALAPISSAAGLVLAAGTLTLALAAEGSAPTPPTTPPATPATTSLPDANASAPTPNVQGQPQLPRPQVSNRPTRVDEPVGDAPRPGTVQGGAAHPGDVRPGLSNVDRGAMQRYGTKVDLTFADRPRLEAIKAICEKAGITFKVMASEEQVAAWNTPGSWTFAATPALQAIRTVCGNGPGALTIGFSDNAGTLVLRPRPQVSNGRTPAPTNTAPDAP